MKSWYYVSIQKNWWNIKSLSHDWPQNQWNISELKVPLHVSSTTPPQPCKSVGALCLQKSERNFNLFFLQGKNFNITSHVASNKDKQISQKIQRYLELEFFIWGFRWSCSFQEPRVLTEQTKLTVVWNNLVRNPHQVMTSTLITCQDALLEAQNLSAVTCKYC